MLLYVNNFWNGFTNKTDPVHIEFFINLFIKVFNTSISVSLSIDDSDILLESVMGNISKISYKEWKYSFLFSGESYYSPNGDTSKLHLYSCILGFTRTRDNYVECPLFIPYIYCNPGSFTPVSHVPTKQACSIISNEKGSIRNNIINALETKISVSHGGRYKNNIGGSVQGMYNSENVLNFYKSHKFSISMENTREEYYITEKLINGFKAGTIPIYWGSSNVTKYFNQDRFLELKSDSDADINAIIDKILSITDEEYMKMVNVSIFIKDISKLIVDLTNDIKQCLNLS
jgi:hypothetical protein